MRFLLSIDCGLTVAKTAVFDESGRKLSEVRTPTPLRGLWMDVEALWQQISGGVRKAVEKSGVRPEQIAAVGLSGHGNGLYALDEQGRPVCGVSSMYDENQYQVDEFCKSNRYLRYFELTRQSCWGGQPMQILKHLKETRPELYGKIRSVLCCKDYLRYCLTGTIGTDCSDFSTSALEPGERGEELCELIGIVEMAQAMPGTARCDAVVGAVNAKAAQETGLAEGTPVAAGGIDLFCCMLGAGVAEEGVCSITAGTWGIAAALSDSISNPEQLTQQCVFLPDLPSAAVVSSPTSCVNLDWFLANVRPELGYPEANEIALGFAPEDVKIIYLPYLYRDMARPEIACSFRNVSVTDTWKEMLRSVFEGVCFAHRLQIERLRHAGVRVDRARMSGGATNSEAWCRLMCDILNLEIEVPAEKQAGLLGAAMMAATAAGIYPTLREAVRGMSAVERSFLPRPDAAYDKKYIKFLEMVGERR